MSRIYYRGAKAAVLCYGKKYMPDCTMINIGCFSTTEDPLSLTHLPLNPHRPFRTAQGRMG